MIKAKAAKATLFVTGMAGAVISSSSKKYEFTDMHSEASRPAQFWHFSLNTSQPSITADNS